MKKKLVPVLATIFSVVCFPISLAGCTPQNNNSSSSEYVTNIKIQFSSTVDQVAVGSQITLRVLVTGTASRDVIWSSKDESVATVDKNGTVTGLKASEVVIVATLKADSNVKAEKTITVYEAVKPTGLTIEGGAAQTGWLKEDLTLKVTAEPEQADKRYTFSSDNTDVATVNESGVVSFITKGNVSVTAKSAVDETVSYTVVFTVKDGPFWTNRGGYSDGMDYSHQDDGDASYLQTNCELKEGVDAMTPCIAWFKTEAATKFYAEAKVGFIQSTSDAWTRIGIGTATNDTNTRAFYYSDKEGRKTTVLDFPVGFGGNQNQSTVWQVNGLGTIDKRAFTLGILRNENNYYYTINGKLYWEEINKRFNDMPANPLIIGKDCTFTVKNAFSTLDETVIDAKLSSAAYQDKWYPASTVGNVTYDKPTDTWSFLNNQREGGNTVYIKQQCAKPYGDAGLAENNFEIDYDISGLQIYDDNPFSYAGVTLRRYDTWTNNFGSDMGSFVMNTKHVFYRLWGSDKNFTEITKKDADSANFASLIGTESHHVKLIRTVNDADSSIQILLDGTPVTWDGQNDFKVAFVGKYLVEFGANDAKCNISNFKITNK